MARILLIGRSGQIGWELERCMIGLGDISVWGRAQLDLQDTPLIRKMVLALAPSLIVNAAAFTDVEGAESNEAAAFAINATAVRTLAQAARELGAVLVHYSTDYVFDGSKPTAYLEDDPTGPLSAYGRSKLAGEQAVRASGCAHLILRTSWVFAARGRNFLRTIVRRAVRAPDLRIVDDQRGAPTDARLIAQVTALMAHTLAVDAAARARVVAGATVHLAAAGDTSWYGFAREIREVALRLGLPVHCAACADSHRRVPNQGAPSDVLPAQP